MTEVAKVEQETGQKLILPGLPDLSGPPHLAWKRYLRFFTKWGIPTVDPLYNIGESEVVHSRHFAENLPWPLMTYALKRSMPINRLGYPLKVPLTLLLPRLNPPVSARCRHIWPSIRGIWFNLVSIDYAGAVYIGSMDTRSDDTQNPFMFLVRVINGTPEKSGKDAGLHSAHWLRVPVIQGGTAKNAMGFTYGIHESAYYPTIRT